MRETEASLSEILKERDALVLAQKLFELDITAYPEISQVIFFQLIGTHVLQVKVHTQHCSRDGPEILVAKKSMICLPCCAMMYR